MTPEDIVQAIRAVITSPVVHSYKVGVTSRPLKKRRGDYRKNRHGSHHLLILQTDLTGDEAVELEADVATRSKQNKRSLLYRKYDPPDRDAKPRRSKGGKKCGKRKNWYLYLVLRDRRLASPADLRFFAREYPL